MPRCFAGHNCNAGRLSMTNPETKTPAQNLQSQLQMMGIMAMAGRDEMADDAYIKAQKIAQEMVEAGL